MTPSIDLLKLIAAVTVLGAATVGLARAPSGTEGNRGRHLQPEQLPADDPVQNSETRPQPASRGEAGGMVFKTRIRPHWFADNKRFWYRNELPGGKREFILVDAEAGVRQLAFDHERLARALVEAGVDGAVGDRLPIEGLSFTEPDKLVLHGQNRSWLCDLKTYQLQQQVGSETERTSAGDLAAIPPQGAPRTSRRRGRESAITFVNRTAGQLKLFWLDRSGWRRSYSKIAAGASHEQHTFAGHVWEVESAEGTVLAVFEAAEQPARASITGQLYDYTQRPGFRRRSSSPGDEAEGGSYTARVRDHNIFLSSAEGGETRLTDDGNAANHYGMLSWSPDTKTLVAFQIAPGDEHEVHLIQSSPRDGGRAQLQSRPYALPGDEFTSYVLKLFDAQTGQPIKANVDPIDFRRPRVRWKKDGRHFTYEKLDRGHQRFRLIEIDAHTGSARNLIDEQAETFINSYTYGRWMTNYLTDTDEIIYVSERDGWRHLYLVDAQAGRIANQITSGEWVVRGIDYIDEAKREIWFHASGMHPEQDPYLIHYYRIKFDGTGLVALTAGDGTHAVRYSPDRKYLIDTYSRVDLPFVHELRRVADGKLVRELERADISQLTENGWEPPEVFAAKGRDGDTDIWGIICRPSNFDPRRKYPIIEDIYAGPHDSHVPKDFSPARRYADLTGLGFVVVKIDGMGTANRSKAFHDVCWRNLKDAGFPDRIAWIKAAATKYPSLDISRVGIYGVSAGGQNAAGAVLFHPEFYKAAVAACGCHDNRMDKASWNEQWMGYPVGPHYAKCSNIENAHRLQRPLLLLVGELDTNVPPESTLRFADALIKADKDFDLLVLPGVGHTGGGSYGNRRRREFFVRHLLDSEPLVQTASDNGPPARAERDMEAEPANTELDLTSFMARRGPITAIASRFRADLGNLKRYYWLPESARQRQRLGTFLTNWLAALQTLNSESLDKTGQAALQELKQEIQAELEQLRHHVAAGELAERFVPFAGTIIQLAEARQRVEQLNARQTAGRLDEMATQIEQTRRAISEQLASDQTPSFEQITDLHRAGKFVERMRSVLERWFAFYDGYDPVFSWWMRAPYEQVHAELNEYQTLLTDGAAKQSVRMQSAGAGEGEGSLQLRELTGKPAGEMVAVLEEFQSRRRQLRQPRRRAPSPPQQKRAKQFYSQWLAAMGQLDFASMQTDDRVDYVLLKNHLTYQIARLELLADGQLPPSPLPADEDGIVGYPIGRQALLLELQHEMIPYTPAELITIAEQEYAWCRAELLKASREMGLGDDWRQAIEKVKGMHVEPGKQPQLIRDLAQEAIDYLEQHQLVTVPPLARETWRMQMMSPRQQLVSPFFLGGEVIRVSYPTDSMSHESKLQSMRGNNIPFARATVHHELIPGHHLQGFMTARYRPHRRLFATPFWGEGWALYWEMVLYDRGFPQTPEDRVGFLVWRSHRCARIIFSLSFHLGRMTPQQCIELLVARVGFERNNATAEVRRSVGRSYSPLYQAAYMLGGLQIRELRKELVDSGKMPERDFHDAILRQNRIPIELLRAILTGSEITPNFTSQWRFYGDPQAPND